MKKRNTAPVPIMDYRQYRKMRRLVHECCNYDGGNCIALDDGEECVCVQSISYSLLCRWTGNWKQPCFIGWMPSVVPSAGHCSALAPTGPNTARNVPDA